MSVPPLLMSFALCYAPDEDLLEILATADNGVVRVPFSELPVLIDALKGIHDKRQKGTLFDDSHAAVVYDMEDLDDGIEGVPPIAT